MVQCVCPNRCRAGIVGVHNSTFKRGLFGLNHIKRCDAVMGKNFTAEVAPTRAKIGHITLKIDKMRGQ